MGVKTGIEWCDSTWNPLEGCSPVSPGCKNCYASATAGRFGGPGQHYEGLVRINLAGKPTDEWNGVIHFAEKHLLDPLKWLSVIDHALGCSGTRSRGRRTCGCPARPRRIFVNSMSDAFHENVERIWLVRIFAVMAATHWHRYQLLTKRPAEMAATLADDEFREDVIDCAAALIEEHWSRFTSMPPGFAWDDDCIEPVGAVWPLPNVWLGVSLENQATADKRWESTRKVSGMGWLTWVSSEPRLSAIDWSGWEFICWLVSGGESGKLPDIRPSHPDWFRADRDWCRSENIDWFFKQWGEWRDRRLGDSDAQPRMRLTDAGADGSVLGSAGANDVWMQRVGKHASGALLDGKEYKNFPEAAA